MNYVDYSRQLFIKAEQIIQGLDKLDPEKLTELTIKKLMTYWKIFQILSMKPKLSPLLLFKKLLSVSFFTEFY